MFRTYEESLTTTGIEKKFQALIAQFRNFGGDYFAGYAEDFGYGIVAAAKDNANIEKKIPLFFEEYNFIISEVNIPRRPSEFIVKVEKIGNEDLEYGFYSVNHVIDFITSHLPIHLEELEFDYMESDDHDAFIREYVRLSLDDLTLQHKFEHCMVNGIDVSAYKGLNVIYSLCLCENDMFDVIKMNEYDYRLSITASDRVIHAIICRADTIMEDARQMIEKYIARRPV